MRFVLAIAACLTASVPAAAWAQAKPADTVTVYRCTDAGGRQSLRDSPCPKGQKQQARTMVRPKDAPARPAAAPPASTTATPVPDVRTVYITPPQPMYECVTHDGQRYTSETGDGNPRWVPLWTQGYRWYGNRPGGSLPRGTVTPAPPLRAGISTAFPDVPTVTPAPPTRPPHGRPPVPWQAASGGGSWIRDSCVALPPREACSLLRDRRDAIRTRFFNAQEKERDALRIEERGINNRLDNDCGGR